MKTYRAGTRFARFAVALFLLTLLVPLPAPAATLSVKQLGCYSEPNCYPTITTAVNSAGFSDTIRVYPGTYNEAVTLDKDLSLIGSGPQLTTIYSTGRGITVQANQTALIQGFTITAKSEGIYLATGTDTIVRNCSVVSNGTHGIQYHNSTSVLLVNNVIAQNASSGSYGSSAAFTAMNNIIAYNGGHGLHVTGPETLIYNNVVGNSLGNYSACAAGTGSISQSPLFLNLATGNFVLQSTSPCINAGRPGTTDADPDGSRNDMGVYGGPESAAFWPYPVGAPTITSLSVTPISVQKGELITIEATGSVLP